ncbi:Tat pathway signal sequence domain protein [Rhodovibrionaceae bacterium A322]
MRRLIAVVGAALLLAGQAVGASAQSSADKTITIELNKLEQRDGACRTYLLFENATDQQLDPFRLDLIFFGSDGVITQRLVVDAAPLRAGKSVVKLFDLAGQQCADVSRILLNDVSPCGDASGERDDCVDLVTPQSRSEVVFFK